MYVAGVLGLIGNLAHLRWLVAPALLCALAINQLVLVRLSNLSAWKGGGFGMFSTMDSPGARYLRIYLCTAEGNIPVLIPAPLRVESIKLRTMPNETQAQALADLLASGTWVKQQMQSAQAYYASLQAPEGLDGAPAAGKGLTNGEVEQPGFVRMLDKAEAVGAADLVVNFFDARVEVWRYRFDANQSQLVATKVLAARSAPRLARGGD